MKCLNLLWIMILETVVCLRGHLREVFYNEAYEPQEPEDILYL